MTGRPPTDDVAGHDAWFCAEVEQGLREAGDPVTQWIPHEQVMDEMQRLLELRIAKARLRRAK
jgi:hypothetical protein